MNIYLIVILLIIAAKYFLDLTLNILNLRHFSGELPPEFTDRFDPQEYRRSRNYLKEKTVFSIVTTSIFTPLIILFILLGGFNLIDQWARSFGLGSIPTGLIFAGTLFFLSSILNLPFSAYRTFVIEEKYGFNRTTPTTFITDIIKSWILAALIGGPVLAGIIWFFEFAGTYAWLYCWGAVTAFQLFLLFIAPVTIFPLFNKFTPLEEGELKSKIKRYVRSRGLKMKGIYRMDGSRRSTKSNAFFTGFGKFRRIVLYDTLIANHSDDELLAVLAHETGHYQLRHILKNVLVSILSTGLMFFILSLFINNRNLFDAFGMEEVSVYAGLFFFAFLYAPIDLFVSIFGNYLSRRFEYAADRFSARTWGRPEAMISALKKLSVDNLTNLTPHPLMVFFTYSHPPVLKRIRTLRKTAEAAGSGKGGNLQTG